MTHCLNMIPGESGESGLEMDLEGTGKLALNFGTIPNEFEVN
jgi:hypothetical protein